MAVDRLLPTEEGAELVALVREIAQAELAPRAAADEAAGRFPRDAFAMLGEVGLLGLPYPEEYGGAGPAVRGLPAGPGRGRGGVDDGRRGCLGACDGLVRDGRVRNAGAAGDLPPGDDRRKDCWARTRCRRRRPGRTSQA